MSHDTLLDLSRWQWALTAAFHITFPNDDRGTSVDETLAETDTVNKSIREILDVQTENGACR